MLYAAMSAKKPTVYEVLPVGELVPDPDCLEPGLSWECERAEVLSSVRIDKLTVDHIRRTMMEDR